MSFALPDALPLLLAAPLLAGLLLFAHRVRRRRLARVAGPRFRRLAGESSGWHRALFPTAVLFALLAIVQPLWGESDQPGARAGMDLVVCLDVSRSMLAEDVEPSRLARARAEIAALAERAAGDRLALVVFAGEAKLVVPLTRDLASLSRMAALQDPLSVPRGGSDLGAAIETALAALDDDGGAILLLTDGEDLEQKGLRAAERARERGVAVHCVGFGSPLGAKIPVGNGFLKDRSGAEVVSRMDPERLGRMADGAFQANGSVVAFYEREVRTTYFGNRTRGRANRFQWPLLAACLLWIAELCTRR